MTKRQKDGIKPITIIYYNCLPLSRVNKCNTINSCILCFHVICEASKYWKEGSNGNEIITTNGITVEVCRGSVVTQKVFKTSNLV